MSDRIGKRLIARAPRLMAMARVAKVVVNRSRGRIHDADYLALVSLRPTGVLLDVGANVGQSAISMLTLCSGVTVYSFEPNPACHPALKALARTYRGRLRIVHAGASDSAGHLDFYVPYRNGRGLLEEGTFDQAELTTASAIERLGPQIDSVRLLSCEVITIDSLHLDPSFVKIDVQGFEPNVLRGMVETIERCRPILMLERGGGDAECDHFLAQRGYRRMFWAKVWSDVPARNSVNSFYLPIEHAAVAESAD